MNHILKQYGGKLLARFTNNWPAKVLSIALAIILFVFHRLSVLESRFFSTPLRIELGGNLAPASAYPQKIRVTLRGEADGIKPILEDDIETYLDLKRYAGQGKGTYRVPVQYRKKGIALEVEPLEISMDPMEVTLELDQRITKTLPVISQSQGYLEPGYELVSSTLTPSQAVVDGPEVLLNTLTGLNTEMIELGGRSDNFSLTLRIINPNPLLLLIRGEGNVEFQGIIGKTIRIRSFSGLPIEPRGLKESLRAEMSSETGEIRLEGNQNELDPYEPQGAVLWVECSSIDGPGTYPLPVKADIPPLFTLIRTDPAQVTLEVRLYTPEEDTHE